MRTALIALAFGCTAARSVPAEPVDLAAAAREAVQHAWNGYHRYAWGHDELKPLTRTARDWAAEPLLITPVDALDTLILLGLAPEAEEARAYIDAHLSFDKDVEVKNFEIVIRVLGGLLSAHELTGDPRLLALADDLGRRLLPVFDSPTRMPYVKINLRTGKTSNAKSNPAEIGTLLLEFGTLARLTGNDLYYRKAKTALVELFSRRSKIGLFGDEIDVETGAWLSRESHIGGGIDSFYEYLIKAWLLFGDEDCKRMFDETIAAVNHWVADESHDGLWYGVVDMETGRRIRTEYGALEAFFPAVLVLAGDLDRARRLEESSFRMWTSGRTEADVFDYSTMRPTHPTWPLRPEIAESAFYLAAATREPRWNAMGHRFMRDIDACCRIEAGYTVLDDVKTGEQGDLMPSFFLAETLKYLWLLGAPDAIDLHKLVFNTEAHPFIIPSRR
ncbi:MAG: glycoside hydrolase family 47 protein [Myxococcales bacterium]|nr:glycoside hydrolase family 47 protein [Myxococcales bacterium]